MNELLDIVRQDRVFHEDIGRRGPVRLFDLLGNRHPLTAHNRSLVANALH